MPQESSDNPLIEKRTLYAGTKPVSFKDGTKVHFHFQTRLCDKEKTLLDDSKKMGSGKPFELVLGKKFKLEVWEAVIQKMALNEVAVFTVKKDLVMQYPFVSKTLRDVNLPREARKSHCCAMTIQTEGVGYDDLNNFLKDPSDLEFTIELVKVEQPEDYEKESWQMDEEEKLKKVPELKEQGNAEFRKKNYEEASDFYAKAIGIIEQLMIKEKPHDEEWNELDKMKVPILLNYAQCKLNQGDYYAVIEHCTTAIKSDPSNVKAYYRRAKAHVGAWNTREAFDDFRKVLELDQSLTTTVKKEMTALEEQIKKKDMEDKQKLKNLFN
ncbi:AH receptor-interacting protein [Tribolium madens]|uniref:AH receptor-interacting protein n=1 Tax=Tribolium madens TaxID=41895 RepID=UPI001CF7276C|nr:AH receptor-interacting protein [Tribolium madens]XP_044269501.1 AH receptor-interacting protein [Tribolium madens]